MMCGECRNQPLCGERILTVTCSSLRLSELSVGERQRRVSFIVLTSDPFETSRQSPVGMMPAGH